MKRNEDVMARARQVNPMPADAFQDLACSPEGQETLRGILEVPRQVQPARGLPRRAIGGLIAAAVLASAGTVAAAVTMNRPDSQQSAQVQDDFSEQATVHLGGWRPELQAERVMCLFPDSRHDIETSASEFPLKQRMTTQDLARECAQGNDSARTVGPFPVNTATVCVSDEGTYPKAVVGVSGVDCSTTARPITSDDLDQLNRMRAIEVAVLAVPSEDGCPTSEQASEWAKARLEEYAVAGLEIRSSSGWWGKGCYRGMIYWEIDQVRIDVNGNQR